MNICIFGGSGLLGQVLERGAKAQGHQVYCPHPTIWDISNLCHWADRECWRYDMYDLFINCAAITDVDGCETNQAETYEVNTIGTYYIARFAKKNNSKLIHISTDYVYDWDNSGTYETFTEYYRPYRLPSGIYARSKLFAEELVRAVYPEAYIIRTAGLFGPVDFEGSYIGEGGFLGWVLNKLEQKEIVPVVIDQELTPTYTVDLAKQIFTILNNELVPDTYHCTGLTKLNWYEFAQLIAKEWGYSEDLVAPTKWEYLGKRAPRPYNTALSSNKLKTFNVMRGITEVLKEIHCGPSTAGDPGIEDSRLVF